MTTVHHLPDKLLPVSIAPPDVDLAVCVMDKSGYHPLVFPVRKCGTDWVSSTTKKRIDIEPTHWRYWTENTVIG